MNFLPTSVKEMQALGWEQADVVLFSGDAYIDHPSFGAAVIGRVLEHVGFRVAIVPQPNWRDDLRDFRKFGRPRVCFAISGGSMDSMVNHYTANLRLRSNDAYTPNGQAGQRPDYAVTVYGQILKRLYPDVPLVIGGIEASLRRFTHYDYWSNTLKPSILVDSQADVLIYGMGERPIVEVVSRLAKGYRIDQLRDVQQTGQIISSNELNSIVQNTEIKLLKSINECRANKRMFADNFRIIEEESNRLQSRHIAEPLPDGRYVLVTPPYPPPSTAEVDSWYDLPYARAPHPRYRGKAIPAWEMIKFSVNIHRGCFGGCAFCTISAHQGRFIASRSEQSIVAEIERIKQMPDFKGYLSDIGGPSANMYMMGGRDRRACAVCRRQSCIFPGICPNLNADHTPINRLYRKVRNISGIKKAFVGSGVRYDLFIDRSTQPEIDYFEELCQHHVSGRLKVAPEHTSDRVLQQMRKPSFNLFRLLKQKFDMVNRKYGMNQQLIPYFISSHPACTDADMQHLANETRQLNFKLEQVQDFTPTPMTLSSTIYYSGIDPYTGKEVYVARNKQDKQRQLSYFFWYKSDKKTGRQFTPKQLSFKGKDHKTYPKKGKSKSK
ncbi:MAG: YgiQ family radical SAM protein [Bacteroidales bacterium]|nr:YgiQ family radical SAM protein [Bacteroidales bacterium]